MNSVLEAIHKLHSTHGNFTHQPISKDDLGTILAACVRGANASNRQSYSIIVIRGQDNVERILKCGHKAPVALVFCVDFNRIYDIGKHLGFESDEDHLFSYLTAHTDAVIAAQTAVIAAASLGIGSLFTNSIHHADRKNLTELCAELKLPKDHIFPVTAVLLGYEDKKPEYLKGRLCGPGVVHYDAYQWLNEQQIEDIISTVNNSDNHFGLRGSCKTYLEFYYTKWAPPNPPSMMNKIDQVLLDNLASFLNIE